MQDQQKYILLEFLGYYYVSLMLANNSGHYKVPTIEDAAVSWLDQLEREGTTASSLHGSLTAWLGQQGSGNLYTVDPSMQPKDIQEGVLIDGVYKDNPTAQNIQTLIKEGSNYVGNSRMNGQYMYVVDADGNIIIGTRAREHMPHPTLVGGENPAVQGAGIVDIRGGKIYSIDNSSGHFKPDNSSLIEVQNAFDQLPPNVFHKDFQGYLPYE